MPEIAYLSKVGPSLSIGDKLYVYHADSKADFEVKPIKSKPTNMILSYFHNN